MAEWISVKDRLPTEKGQYLTYYRHCHWDTMYSDYGIDIDSFKGGKAPEKGQEHRKWAKNKFHRVSHWMPLPEPPKEVTQDG